MTDTGRAVDQGLALRSGARRAAWVDPSGIRSALRHRMSRGAAATILGGALIGLVVGANDRGGLLVVALVAAIRVVLFPKLSLGSVPSAIRLRAEIVAWSLGLIVLAGVGRGGGPDLFIVVAVSGFAIAMFVGLTEPRIIAGSWAAATAILLGITATLAAAPAFAALMVTAAVIAGVIAGDQAREVLERFLGARRQLMLDVSQLPSSDDPFVTAELLLRPLVHWTPLKNPALIWFRDDGKSLFLAVAGADLPPTLGPGRLLPEPRNKVLRAQASSGPWVSGWAVRDDDGGYSRGIADLGIHAVAYVPLVFKGSILGLIAAGLNDRADDRSSMAEYIPTLVQFADAAAIELGPSLQTHERGAAARLVLDEILADRAFRPVFQPIRRLDDDRVVGYEALTRFDSPWSTTEVFAHARVAGRLLELEEATLAAAIEASETLPRGRWLSLNASPGLMADTDRLGRLLAGVDREIVIELSEHDVIADYDPIAGALARVGGRCRLAVDDAGAGFASLRHILEVRPTYVKLDIGLVHGVAGDVARTALVAGLVHFAADAGFTLIAEGIEAEADRRTLEDLGVGLGQGYLLGEPTPVDRAPTRARRRARP